MKAELTEALKQAVRDGVIHDFESHARYTTVWPINRNIEKTACLNKYLADFLAAEREYHQKRGAARFTVHDLYTGEELGELDVIDAHTSEDGSRIEMTVKMPAMRIKRELRLKRVVVCACGIHSLEKCAGRCQVADESPGQ